MSEGIDEVLLLTGVAEAPALADVLRAANPALAIRLVTDRAGVTEAVRDARPGTRLIAVCTSVIVPAEALLALPGPSYNFHPGPPNRPGRYPSVFALYEDDGEFGITVHEMAPRVDSGPIVAVERFPIPTGCDLVTLESLTYRKLFAVFERLAPWLAVDAAPLPQIGVRWEGAKTTYAQVQALSRIDGNLPEAEIARRRRACGGQLLFSERPGN